MQNERTATALIKCCQSVAPLLFCALTLCSVAWIGITRTAQAGDTLPKVATKKPTTHPSKPTPCTFDFAAWRANPSVGINLAGPAFAPDKLPGTYGTDFIYPDAASLDYWQAQDVRLIRTTFQWERMQPHLFAPLNPVELSRLRIFLHLAAARGQQVIIGPHNYARYSIDGTPTLIGSEAVPHAAFADFWRKIATAFQSTPGIFGYSLMNEPHDTGGSWKTSAQVGLDAIREIDNKRLVLVPGDYWSSAWKWQIYSNDLILNDPSRCLLYDAHLYFDTNSSGFYEKSYDGNGTDPEIGARRVAPFLDWLKEHEVDGIVTEFGVPNDDPRWLPVAENFLNTITGAGVGGTYWAAGPWWGDYPLSIEPKDGQPAKAMSVLSKYFEASTNPTEQKSR